MKCLICNTKEAKIKYCSNKCAYKAIEIKSKQRQMKKIKPIFRKGMYRNYQWQVKLFRCPYPHDNPENYIQAVFFQCGYKGYWIFRNKLVWNNWPSQA